MVNWDYSYASFKLHGPDHPENVDFAKKFPTGAFVVAVPRSDLSRIVDQRTVSLDVATIERDVSPPRWVSAKSYAATGGPLSPPWGRCSKREHPVAIAQGRHRFQLCVVQEEPFIPIVVNEALAKHLRDEFSLSYRPMDP